jgi:hypothetical protein
VPLTTDIKYDKVLTNISIQYQPAPDGYLADMVLPPVPVAVESGIYWTYDRSRFDVPDSKRVPRSEYNRVDWSATTNHYLTQQYGLEGEIDDQERKVASAPLDLDVDTTEIVTDMVLNGREKRIVDLVMDTSVVTQNTTLLEHSQWSDYSNSDPRDDVKTARNTIFAATGYRPNRMVMGYMVYEVLKLHPAIAEVIKYTERAIVTKQLLATLFEVDEVMVGGVLRRTSKEGRPDVLTDVWGTSVLIYYADTAPSLKRASFGYQLREEDLRVFRYREDKRDVDVIRVTEKQAEQIVAPELGYLIAEAIAS